jgi:hypothetical protein
MMRKNKNNATIIVRGIGTLILMVAGFYCAPSPNLTGGGSDTEVSGRIVSATGVGVARVRVALISSTFNPIFDTAISAKVIDTTDANGNYQFKVVGPGKFNIEAALAEEGAKLFLNDINVTAGKVVSMGDHALKPTARMVIPLPDSVQGGPVYVFFPGTENAVMTVAGAGSVIFDSLAQGIYASIVYQRAAGDRAVELFSDVVIDSAGLFVLNPYSAWMYSASISLNTTESGAKVPQVLLNFPLLVRLTAVDIDFSQAKKKGEDIRITKSDNSALPYEIEYWDSASAQASIWIKADTIYGNSAAQYFIIRWGNSEAKTLSSSAPVFDTGSGFRGVWHFGESGGTTAPDATINKFDGTPTAMDGSSDVIGLIGRAQDFDGATQYISIQSASPSALDVQVDSFYTVSAWCYERNVLKDADVVVSKGSAQYCLLENELNQWGFWGGLAGYGVDTTTTAPATVNTWTYLTGVRSGKKQFLYVNGVPVDSTLLAAAANPDLSNNFHDLVIGRQSDDESQWFNGIIDEVRVSRGASSPGWIKLCYENQKAGQALVTIKKVQ